MKTSKKVGIAALVVFVLFVGTVIALSAIEQSVKEVYKKNAEWNDTDEGLKNAFCHKQTMDWNYCLENARVITALDGEKYVMMPTPTKEIGLTGNQVGTIYSGDEWITCEEYVQKGRDAIDKLEELWREGKTDKYLEKLKHGYSIHTQRNGACAGY